MPSPDEELAHDELSAYTLSHGGAEFIHQHVVDAWQAQHATAASKPVTVFFSLAGLYLHLERGFSGREVQRAHMQLARQSKQWPTLQLPAGRGSVTVVDVMSAPPGDERDRMIRMWCTS